MQINEFTERIGLHATFIELTAKSFLTDQAPRQIYDPAQKRMLIVV